MKGHSGCVTQWIAMLTSCKIRTLANLLSYNPVGAAASAAAGAARVRPAKQCTQSTLLANQFNSKALCKFILPKAIYIL